MTSLTIFSGDFCRGSSVVKELLGRTGLKLVTDQELVARAAGLADLSSDRIERAFSPQTSVFDRFTHEKGRAIACLRLALAELVANDSNLLLAGYLSHLLPREITHVMKVCLIADLKFRVQTAIAEQGLSEKAAIRLIGELDVERRHWVKSLHLGDDPWEAELYDMVIPMATTGVDEAAALITEYLGKKAVAPDRASRQAVTDFRLAAEVAMNLAREGHEVQATARNGVVTLTVHKHVLLFNRLAEELREIVGPIPGVSEVRVEVGKEFHRADIYRKHDFDIPSKVLLVDDEREFVKTLSERLILRDMGSAVAYDGQSALEIIAADDPEVLVLDLKMPGIDGIEVLRRVKKLRPGVEVIILTGHGTEEDRKICMELGAFAYLQKPVDIDLLIVKLREAHDRVRQARRSS